jgi:hypothetical protein
MDVFKFNNPTNPTKMEQGEIINGIKSKLWIERFVKEGEFKFVANADSGIMEKLPVDTFVSHTDTAVIMVVKDHEIKSSRNKQTEVTISGESFESFMKDRVVGAGEVFPSNSGSIGQTVALEKTWVRARALLRQNFDPALTTDSNDDILYLTVGTDAIPGTTDLPAGNSPWGNLDKEVREILAIDNLGMKVLRPGIWAQTPILTPPAPDEMALFFYAGVDRSGEVVFTYDREEIENADYLRTSRGDINAGYVFGKWVRVRVVDPTKTGYFRRQTHIDGSNVDNPLDAAPVGAPYTDAQTNMTQMANQVIASHNSVFLLNPEISKTGTRWQFREDYEVGDIVTVHGEYGAKGQFRISEYVEIEDENGVSGYPTLSEV